MVAAHVSRKITWHGGKINYDCGFRRGSCAHKLQFCLDHDLHVLDQYLQGDAVLSLIQHLDPQPHRGRRCA